MLSGCVADAPLELPAMLPLSRVKKRHEPSVSARDSASGRRRRRRWEERKLLQRAPASVDISHHGRRLSVEEAAT